MGDTRYVYRGAPFATVPLRLVTYKPEYFDLAIELESEAFYELRKRNNILPHKLNQSSEEELEKIRAFLLRHKSTFFFLFEGNALVGNILILKNFIQSVAVAPGFRRKGYGTLLTRYGVNQILHSGYDRAELKVLDGNVPAHAMYLKIGFEKCE